MLAQFPDEHFDWIYIDGDHSYEGASRDARVAATKVKPGGHLVFNDFAHADPYLGAYGVHRALSNSPSSADGSSCGGPTSRTGCMTWRCGGRLDRRRLMRAQEGATAHRHGMRSFGSFQGTAHSARASNLSKLQGDRYGRRFAVGRPRRQANAM